jgi:endonuclease/exonuclease/phosphatase family metal-dependent hydrolase
MGAVPLPALVAAVLLGLALVAGPATGAPPAVRVVTFNMLHGGPMSGLSGADQHLDDRLRLVARELRELDPDIVALQESSITRGRNAAARLAAELNLHWAHASATRRVSRIGLLDDLLVWAIGFEEGSAILSRWPIVATEIVDLPRCEKFWEPRIALRATVATSRGPLEVFSTHLGRDACHARRIAEVVRAHPGPLPALVMGDFNASESTEEIRSLIREANLVDAFRAANPAASGATVWQRPGAPDPTVTRRVDFIFLRPGDGGPTPVRASRVVLATPGRLANGTTLWPSDHYGVVADIAIDGLEARR